MPGSVPTAAPCRLASTPHPPPLPPTPVPGTADPPSPFRCNSVTPAVADEPLQTHEGARPRAAEVLEEMVASEARRRPPPSHEHGVARPRPLLGPLAQAGADGVQRDVARELECVRLARHDGGSEPTLEHVPHPPVHAVVHARVARSDRMHPGG